MIIDCHVHVCALTPGHGCMSDRLLKSLPFRFMRWRLGSCRASDAATERAARRELLARTIDETDEARRRRRARLRRGATTRTAGSTTRTRTSTSPTTTSSSWLQRHPKMLFGASVHPYRKDAVAELERCVAAGAVLLKWLPIAQGFNPADERCIPFYEALAHHKLPLLCHTGGEKSLPNVDTTVADPLPARARARARRHGHRRPLRHALGARSRPTTSTQFVPHGPRVRTLLRRHVRAQPADAVVRVQRRS